MNDLFPRGKSAPQCLSHFQISQYVLGNLSDVDRITFEQHFLNCELCRQFLEGEKTTFEAAKYEAIPERIQRASELKPRKSTLMPWIVGAASVSALALMTVFLLPVLMSVPKNSLQEFHSSRVRLKGTIDLEASIRRNGQVQSPLPLDKLRYLRKGDELRLKIVGGKGQKALLQSCEGKRCEVLFRSAVPDSGWLPIGLTATPGKMRLELYLCKEDKFLDSLQKEKLCHSRQWQLETQP